MISFNLLKMLPNYLESSRWLGAISNNPTLFKISHWSWINVPTLSMFYSVNTDSYIMSRRRVDVFSKSASRLMPKHLTSYNVYNSLKDARKLLMLLFSYFAYVLMPPLIKIPWRLRNLTWVNLDWTGLKMGRNSWYLRLIYIST